MKVTILKLVSVLILVLLCSLISPAQVPSKGSVFITGHDPDFHATRLSENPIGARNILRVGIEFVLSGSDKLFLVLQSNWPPRIPAGHADPIAGLEAAGFIDSVDFIRTDIAGFLTADFDEFGAIFVPSDFGGLLTQEELDALISRKSDIIDYVNRGGGLIALAESGGGASNIRRDFFGFLPFVVSAVARHQPERNTLTDFGRSLGLIESDINGNFSHTIFLDVGGMEVVDFDPRGDILSAAFRGQICEVGVIPQINVDIKPQACPNRVNVGSEVTLFVAVLGTADFDVQDINAATVQLEGISPVSYSIVDTATPLLSPSDSCDCTDEGPDGIADLLLEFNVADLVAAPSTGTEQVLNLTGVLQDSCSFTGFDCIIFDSLACDVTITSPRDSLFLCNDSVMVVAALTVMGGNPPFNDTTCTINGVPSDVHSDGTFMTLLPLMLGENNIIAQCTVIDAGLKAIAKNSAGRFEEAVCIDSIVVFSDPTPPACTFDFSNLPTITGTAFDLESGILSVEVIKMNNRTVEVDPFVVGDPVVTFSSDPVDPALRSGFTLRVTNVAGCVVECDPISLRLAPTEQSCDFTFELPPTDRFVHVQNHGLSRIFLDINEHEIQLVADDAGTGRNGNTFYMPFEGKRTIEIAEFLVAGDNQYRVHCEGPTGSFAQLLIADFYIDDGQGTPTLVDDRDQSPVALPQVFALGANYPNPFNPETRITFEIPAGWQHPVKLRIYNAQGQLLTTLIDGLVAPGSHTAVWRGRDNHGNHVASGVYFYQILSRDVVQTRKMTLLQ